MSSKSDSNSNGESMSIIEDEQLAKEGEREQDLPEADRLSIKSVHSSMTGGSKRGSDTEDEVEDVGMGGSLVGSGSDAEAVEPPADSAIEGSESVEEIMYGPEARGIAISRLVAFSLVLITVPLAVMFVTYRFVFSDHFGLARDQAVLYAGVVAAFVVYLVLGTYAWLAYREEQQVAQRIEESKKAE